MQLHEPKRPTRSDWMVGVLEGPPRILAVIDTNLGGTSVTNDIEAVLAVLNDQLGLQGAHVLYRDSAGNWDAVNHANGEFVGFRLLGAATLEDAVKQLNL